MLVYCSFASETDCLGVLVLNCSSDNPVVVASLAWMLGLNPGGELLCVGIPDDFPEYELYAAHTNRLIPKEEARELFEAKSIREHEDEERRHAN